MVGVGNRFDVRLGRNLTRKSSSIPSGRGNASGYLSEQVGDANGAATARRTCRRITATTRGNAVNRGSIRTTRGTEDGLNCVVDCAAGCVIPGDCDDADPCTIDDCVGGVCVNDPIDCDDADACTVDSCSGGVCFNDPIDCNDGDACTADSCDPGSLFSPRSSSPEHSLACCPL